MGESEIYKKKKIKTDIIRVILINSYWDSVITYYIIKKLPFIFHTIFSIDFVAILIYASAERAAHRVKCTTKYVQQETLPIIHFK